MSENLNQNLYSRFGLELQVEKVQNGCKKYLKGLILTNLAPIVSPDDYKDSKKLWKIQSAVLEEMCYQMFFDIDDWYGTEYSSGLKRLVERELSDKFVGLFNEYLVRLQILLNIITKYRFIRFELDCLASEIKKYFDDFPILGITIKIYKTKAPLILPSVSKIFNKEMENVLGLLEHKKYKDVLDSFEEGLKEFLEAKTKGQLKNIVEDMLSACDELVKIVMGKNNKGFKHVFKKGEYEKFGLNNYQKEIFRNLRDYMDKIKHGDIKQYDREDIEMIISFTANFIRYSINYYEKS